MNPPEIPNCNHHRSYHISTHHGSSLPITSSLHHHHGKTSTFTLPSPNQTFIISPKSTRDHPLPIPTSTASLHLLSTPNSFLSLPKSIPNHHGHFITSPSQGHAYTKSAPIQRSLPSIQTITTTTAVFCPKLPSTIISPHLPKQQTKSQIRNQNPFSSTITTTHSSALEGNWRPRVLPKQSSPYSSVYCIQGRADSCSEKK
ncbi:hypothetical protein M0R45_019192 [Rubus argutus]|uniref:Uncharacterized protein n=1 Tax=Rubus argutus TaxID=59490 RepID=A0AAW1X6J5_RUBAR